MYFTQALQLSYCKYTSRASEAIKVKLACPLVTVVVSKVSVPLITHVPSVKPCPPKVGGEPASTLLNELAAVSLLAFTLVAVNPVSTKVWLPLVPLA